MYYPIMFFPYFWDILVVAIGSNTTKIVLDDMVSSLLLEEMRRNNMEQRCFSGERSID
jgi:hypothetical protein